MPSPDTPDLVSLFVAPLNRVGVPYMVTGSVAAGTYGEPRMTNDIDVVVALGEAHVATLHDAFDEHDFYVPPRETMEEEQSRPRHGHFNLIHRASALKADVFLAGDDPLHRWAFERREQVVVGTERVWLAPPAYVIVRKLEYLRDGGSPKHTTDIRAMLEVLGDRIDVDEVQRLVESRSLETEWGRVTTGHSQR